MKKIILIFVLAISAFVYAQDKTGPKIYIESISNPTATTSPVFGTAIREGDAQSSGIIEKDLAKRCTYCQFIQKKEAADYILVFKAVGTDTNWSVIDTRGDGKVIGSKTVSFYWNANKDAINLVMADWAKRPPVVKEPECPATCKCQAKEKSDGTHKN